METVSDEMNLTFHGSWGAYPSPEKPLFSLPSAFDSSSTSWNFSSFTNCHTSRLITSKACNTGWCDKSGTHWPISGGSNSDGMTPITISWFCHGHGFPVAFHGFRNLFRYFCDKQFPKTLKQGLGCCHSATSSMLTEAAAEAKAAVEKSFDKDKNCLKWAERKSVTIILFISYDLTCKNERKMKHFFFPPIPFVCVVLRLRDIESWMCLNWLFTVKHASVGIWLFAVTSEKQIWSRFYGHRSSVFLGFSCEGIPSAGLPIIKIQKEHFNVTN